MYKVKDTYYNCAQGVDVENLITVDDAIVQALRVKDGYGSFPDRKSIEERIESHGKVIARLLSHLLHEGTLTPQTLSDIIQWDAEIDVDKFVEVDENPQ
jgi:hypothetical protein